MAAEGRLYCIIICREGIRKALIRESVQNFAMYSVAEYLWFVPVDSED